MPPVGYCSCPRAWTWTTLAVYSLSPFRSPMTSTRSPSFRSAGVAAACLPIRVPLAERHLDAAVAGRHRHNVALDLLDRPIHALTRPRSVAPLATGAAGLRAAWAAGWSTGGGRAARARLEELVADGGRLGAALILAARVGNLPAPATRPSATTTTAPRISHIFTGRLPFASRGHAVAIRPVSWRPGLPASSVRSGAAFTRFYPWARPPSPHSCLRPTRAPTAIVRRGPPRGSAPRLRS